MDPRVPARLLKSLPGQTVKGENNGEYTLRFGGNMPSTGFSGTAWSLYSHLVAWACGSLFVHSKQK